MALKASYDSVYRSKKGTPVCRYVVSGNTAELKAYKKSQGEHFVEDKAKGILWFTTNFHGKSIELIITEAGKVVANNEEQLLREMTVQQSEGRLGEALASELAKDIIQSSFSGGNASPAPPVEATGMGNL